MKIFLDDVRIPEECIAYMYKRIGSLNALYLSDWVIVRNYDDFVRVIKSNIDKITHVSFDHDLADDHYDPTMYIDQESYDNHISNSTEKTGYDCAVFLKNHYTDNGVKFPIMFVHSMNPVGTKKIINLFQ